MKAQEKTVIVNAHVISPDVEMKKAVVVIKGSKIDAVMPQTGSVKDLQDQIEEGDGPFKGANTLIDVKGCYVVPGFIDVHTHGACDADFSDEVPATAENLQNEETNPVFKIAKAKQAEGCTSFLPTTLTLGYDTLENSARLAAGYKKAGEPYAKVIGIHLEGPFINPTCLGAQNPKFVKKPDIKEVLKISKICKVAQVSYAPEMEGGAKFAADCLKNGVVPSCGHTGSTLAQFMPAYEKGLRHMTHFCNQMTKLHHREIGMVGAGFLLDDLQTEVICDKIHLCPDMLRLIFTKRPLSSIQMITDSLRCSHLPDGFSFKLGGIPVRLQNGEARLVEGGNLAGSTLWMNKGLKNIAEVTGLPLKDIIRVTSWNQAIELGLGKQLGKIEKGFTADIAVLDKKTFDVKSVIINGEIRQ